MYSIINKYHNRKTTVDGVTFDSKREADRYCELRLLERCGYITNLELQKRFILIDKSKYGQSLHYVADFVYTENGKLVVEDVKGVKTAVYSLKKRMLAERYGIVIKET
jgi:hypothetical protein